MVNIVGHIVRLTRLQVQEQAADSSGTPLDYKGRIMLDPTLLDVERLESALETQLLYAPFHGASLQALPYGWKSVLPSRSSRD